MKKQTKKENKTKKKKIFGRKTKKEKNERTKHVGKAEAKF